VRSPATTSSSATRCCSSTSRSWPTPPRRSATPRSATAARSAARWPTADPASDLPAAALALGATLVAEGPNGRREIPVDEFFTGFLETALADDELLVEVRIPKATGAGWSFQKFKPPGHGLAIVGVAAVHAPAASARASAWSTWTAARSAAAAAEAAVAGGASAADAAEQAPEGLDPPEDANASVEFRQHLARVLVRRALDEAGVGF